MKIRPCPTQAITPRVKVHSPDEEAEQHPGPAEERQFSKASKRLLFDDSLKSSEKLLLIAIGLYDWGKGNGGRPCNATLGEILGVSKRQVQRLLEGLEERGYVERAAQGQSRQNPTGRVVKIQAKPKAREVDTPRRTGHQSESTPVTSTSPQGRHTGHGWGDIQVTQIDLRTDSKSESSQDDPSLGQKGGADIAVPERLANLARQKFTGDGAADRVISAIPRLLAGLADKTAAPDRLLAKAIGKGEKATVAGREVKFLGTTIRNMLQTEVKQAPRLPAVPPTNVAVEYNAQELAANQEHDRDRERWLALPAEDRDAIERSVKQNAPNWLNRPRVLDDFCFVEMKRRFPPEPSEPPMMPADVPREVEVLI